MMVLELVYTSAPQGLHPGSRGFCTVAATLDLPRTLASRLEALSGYRHVHPPHEERADLNPVVCSHLRLIADGQVYHVLSRIAAAGLDYTKRSNKIAHHLALIASELGAAGPAWLLSRTELWRSDWHEQPRLLPARSGLPDAACGADACPTWVELTGDANWAQVLAESVTERGIGNVNVVFRPGTDNLRLVREALNLLPPRDRWKVTFSTYYTQLPPWADCAWRFLLQGSPEAAEARRAGRGLIIDLGQPAAANDASRRSRGASLNRTESAAAPDVPAGAARPPRRPPRPASGIAFVTPLRIMGERLPGALSAATVSPRRWATLRNRLLSVVAAVGIALAVVFLGCQILDWRSNRERGDAFSVPAFSASPVAQSASPVRPAKAASGGDAGDQTAAHRGSALESDRAGDRHGRDAGGEMDASASPHAVSRDSQPALPPGPAQRVPNAAAKDAGQPSARPPKPKKHPFAELMQATAALQTPQPATDGPCERTEDAPSEQQIGFLFLDEPAQLKLALIGDVLGGGRRFELSGPEAGPGREWQWTAQCKSARANEVGRFWLRQMPTTDGPNRCELGFRWSSFPSAEFGQLVNCLLVLTAPGDGQAEGDSRELRLRPDPKPEKREFGFWPDPSPLETRFVMAGIPVPQPPQTGVIKLRLTIAGFAESIQREYTFHHSLPSRTQQRGEPETQPFLADAFSHISVRATAEMDDRRSVLRVWIDLLAQQGDAAVESKPVSREALEAFCRLPQWKITEIEDVLRNLRKTVADQQTAVENLEKKRDEQRAAVEEQLTAVGRRKPGKAEEGGKPLPGKRKLEEIEGNLRKAEVARARLREQQKVLENTKAAYESLAEEVKEYDEIRTRLKLKAVVTASIPRAGRPGTETYELPLATVTCEPPPP